MGLQRVRHAHMHALHKINHYVTICNNYTYSTHFIIYSHIYIVYICVYIYIHEAVTVYYKNCQVVPCRLLIISLYLHNNSKR